MVLGLQLLQLHLGPGACHPVPEEHPVTTQPGHQPSPHDSMKSWHKVKIRSTRLCFAPAWARQQTFAVMETLVYGGGNGGGAGRADSFSTRNQFYSEQTQPLLCIRHIDAKMLNYFFDTVQVFHKKKGPT